MLKKPKIVVFFIILFVSKTLFSSNSSSYLISQTAFNNNDFKQVLLEFTSNKNNDYKSNFLDELISAVITDNIDLAEKISNNILLKDPINQEAKLVNMVRAFNNKQEYKLKKLRFDNEKNKNDLFEFIFLLKMKLNQKKK